MVENNRGKHRSRRGRPLAITSCVIVTTWARRVGSISAWLVFNPETGGGACRLIEEQTNTIEDTAAASWENEAGGGSCATIGTALVPAAAPTRKWLPNSMAKVRSKWDETLSKALANRSQKGVLADDLDAKRSGGKPISRRRSARKRPAPGGAPRIRD